MDSPSKNTADDDPEGTREKTELCCQDRTEERSRGSNSSKMMSKKNELVCFYVINCPELHLS